MGNNENTTSVENLLSAYGEGSRDFHHTILIGANLSGARMPGVNFGYSNLSNTTLAGADLRGANFASATLSPINLAGADLSDAELVEASLTGDLSNANLQGANLGGACFRGCDLRGANFTGADLSHADLRYTRLEKASFLGANLMLANLTEAVVTGLDLTNAQANQTVFGALDMREVQGLEEMLHGGPSLVDQRTLELSRGQISDKFLRGVGFSAWQIELTKLYNSAIAEDTANHVLYEAYRLRVGTPIAFQSVFISHSSDDRAFCEKLHDDLEGVGVRCWLAEKDLRGGQKLHEQIERGIHLHERLLLVLSEPSLRSQWVTNEILLARRKAKGLGQRVLFPIGLVPFARLHDWRVFDPTMQDYADDEIKQFFIPDFTEWRDPQRYQESLQGLISDLRTVDRAPTSSRE